MSDKNLPVLSDKSNTRSTVENPRLAKESGVTMTSLELVAFINEFRKVQALKAGQLFPSKGYAELQHKHFLEKVIEVLGERSAEFSADLPDSYGRPRKGYRFPKREACLMAMSYSFVHLPGPELKQILFNVLSEKGNKE